LRDARRARKDLQGRKDLKASRARLGRKARKASKAALGRKVLKAQKANRVRPDRKGHKAQKASKVRRVRPPPVKQVLRGPRACTHSGKIRVMPPEIATSHAARVKSWFL